MISMGLLERIRKIFLGEETNDGNATTSKTELRIKDSFNPIASRGGIAEVNIEGSFNTYNGPVTYIDSSSQPVNHPLIIARKNQIKTLMDMVNTEEALELYLKLQTDIVGDALSIDDKFYILNGIYNCKVNLNVNDVELDSIKSKIEVLSNASDYHKFIYLTAIRSYNKQDFANTISLCDEANLLNQNYDKARLLKLLAQGIQGSILYEFALTELDQYLDKYKGDTKELSNVLCTKADLAYMTKHLEDAIIFYKEAYSIQNMLHYQLGVGLSYFSFATKDTTEKGYITFDKVDFDMLLEAVNVFEDILEQMKGKKDILILKRMIPFYVNALEMIDEPQKVIDLTMQTEYIEGFDSEDVSKMKAHAGLKLGRNPEDLTEGLNSNEKLKLDVTWLMYKGDHKAVVEIIGSIMDTIFIDDEQMIAFYLISLSKTDTNKFKSMFEKYSNGRENEVRFRLIWIQYLESNGEIEVAKAKLDDLLKDSPNKVVVNDAYRFYKRHGYVKDAFDITSAVMDNKFSVLRGDLPDFIEAHFFTLLNNKDYEELDGFYNQIDFEILTNKIKLQIEIEYLNIKGEVIRTAEKCVEYSELTSDYNIALKGACLYIKGGNTDNGIELLEDLLYVKNIRTSDVYMQLAQAYVLKEDYDNAFKMAYQAKETDKDHYKSESHRFFVSLSLRVNRVDDSVRYMGEFHEEFPKNDWIKPVTIIKKDNEGNESVDLEAINSVIGDRTPYNTVREIYFSYQIGLSTYMKLLNETKIDHIFAEMRYLKRKIKIASGYIQLINEEAKLINDIILVDTLSLFVLAETDILELLEDFDKVFVTYSTIEFIQTSLLMNESKVYRKILSFIKNKSNIIIVPISAVEIIHDDRFLEETCHNLGYSINNKIPYLCVDFNVKEYMKDIADYVVGISSLIRGLSLKKLEKRDKYSRCNNKLLKAGFSIISFNAFDVMEAITSLEDYEKLEDELIFFLCMDRYSDYESHVVVYNYFLLFIEQKVEKDVYKSCVITIFKYLDRYLGKTQYYYQRLQTIANSRLIRDPFFITNNIVYEFLSYSNYIQDRLDIDFYRMIYNSNEYKKLNGIINAVLNGVFRFLGRYKNNPDEFDEMFTLIRENMKNIDDKLYNNLIEEMRKLMNKQP